MKPKSEQENILIIEGFQLLVFKLNELTGIARIWLRRAPLASGLYLN
jgi:hypothetical protein